jgi:TorA maturation chaperone TorD
MRAWESNNFLKAINYLKLEKTFLEEHALKWIPDFCRLVERISKERFYIAVARLTKKFLELDIKNIINLLKSLKAIANI